MEKRFKLQDVPEDVLWVWSLDGNEYLEYIGIDSWRRVQETKRKYPEWFAEIKPRLKEELFERSKDLLVFGTGGEMEQGSFEEIWKEEMAAGDFKKEVQGDWEGVEDRAKFLDYVVITDKDGNKSWMSAEQKKKFLEMDAMIRSGYEFKFSRGRRYGRMVAFKKMEEKTMEKVRVNRFMGHDKDGLAVYMETEELARKRDSGLDGLEEFESRRFKEEGVRRWRYFHYLYEDRRKEQLDVYRIFDGRLNGRSMTQRVEQRKRKGWWFTEIQRHRAKYIFGIDPYMPEIRQKPMDWGI